MLDLKTTLYDAACQSLISDKSKSNCWKLLTNAFLTCRTDPSLFWSTVRETEEKIKQEFDTKLSNAWSSAKSVISTMQDMNLPLQDDNGCTLGKTACQLLIKKHKIINRSTESIDQDIDDFHYALEKAKRRLSEETVRQIFHKIMGDV